MAKSVTIYGIKNCDTMKKARAWLEQHGVDYVFHDYKTEGIQRERLQQWCKKRRTTISGPFISTRQPAVSPKRRRPGRFSPA